jgi:hypothetical protein
MSTDQSTRPSDLADVASKIAPQGTPQTDGLGTPNILDDYTEKRIDEIEMIGEEVAAGFRPPGVSDITPGMRYLHCSRTIHQLTGDRNRAVGLYIAVATILWTASSALLNARPSGRFLVPIETIQQWCLPVTFGTLAVLALFVAFLLIRTRIGLIYEVAKMNVLLGLPVGRVKRINPLSLFFIMHAMISIAGGASAAVFSVHLLRLDGVGLDNVAWPSALIGVAVAAVLMILYVATVYYTTSDAKLQNNGK